MTTIQASVRAEDLSQVTTSVERIPEAGILVIFGASGDLTKRKLLPALFHLRQVGLLRICARAFSPLAAWMRATPSWMSL